MAADNLYTTSKKKIHFQRQLQTGEGGESDACLFSDDTEVDFYLQELIFPFLNSKDNS